MMLATVARKVVDTLDMIQFRSAMQTKCLLAENEKIGQLGRAIKTARFLPCEGI